jgi:hypothetical protein
MGYSKKRTDRNGKARYTACYLDVRGSLRSAGTFSNKKDADKASGDTRARPHRRAAVHLPAQHGHEAEPASRADRQQWPVRSGEKVGGPTGHGRCNLLHKLTTPM